ncbi:MBOAT, membrane-bound O-acyltransferase family-domain-containing protein [Phanerochaete sordida]|uniref:O-acyltransferase n=1 Tax=Phanerochaete sordida TaxID=48140 RepID=A0A9P3LEQ3_9APHY|nr:MBOAT, membrane-bound O-acyltransferase family-domain-containing protein [Phanerochaete sordida]
MSSDDELADLPPTIHLHLDDIDIDKMSSTETQFTTAILEVIEPPSNVAGKPRTANRTPSGGIETTQGTIYVSKPVRTGRSKKLRAMVSFSPRKSTFDITNEKTVTNEFRGFFTLFWISMFLMAVRTYVRSIETNGKALSLDFAMKHMFSEDTLTLFISDGVLVLSTFICVPFAKAVANRWIPYYRVGVFIQHIWQATVLFTAIKWAFHRHWPWVQSGYLTLHTLTMIMKMHSYMNINGYLSHVHQQAEAVLEQLRQATEKVGGWDEAIAAAESNRRERERATLRLVDDAPTNDSPVSAEPPSLFEKAGEPTLRQRATAAGKLPQPIVPTADAGHGPAPLAPASEANAAQIMTTGNRVLSPEDVLKPAPHPLVDHPDEALAALAREYSELDAELVSTGPEYVRWPHNISLKNFATYMIVPTLVYEMEYPRTDRIRPLYVFEKTVATFGTFALLYTVTESFIFPLTPTPDQSFLRSLLDLALPFMIAYLLLFYLIFECICNGFAELSRFADRQFYEDWWNATSWDEFSRKWNKPVHTFLLRHVYASSISSYKLSRSSAMFFTFLLSAAVHELVMAIVTKKIRLYLFTLQLAQIPLIAVGRMPAIKRNKLFGNIVFWLGLYAGFPLLCVAYCAY